MCKLDFLILNYTKLRARNKRVPRTEFFGPAQRFLNLGDRPATSEKVLCMPHIGLYVMSPKYWTGHRQFLNLGWHRAKSVKFEP